MSASPEELSSLGVEPSKSGLTFVFFEGGALVEWGVRYTRRRVASDLAALDSLLARYAPDLLVLEDPVAQGCRRQPRARKLLKALIDRAGQRGVAFVAVSRAEVRRAWAMRGVMRQDAAAEILAGRYRELAQVKPPPRKVYMGEDERQSIFDAVTLVLHLQEDVPQLAA